MSDLARISISLESDLLDRFDAWIEETGYPTRSEAVKGLIRECLVTDQWIKGQEVAGVLTVVYDHHRPSLLTKFVSLQHNFEGLILATQHIHLDHSNCLEAIILRGRPLRIRDFLVQVKALKGITHAELTMSTVG